MQHPDRTLAVSVGRAVFRSFLPPPNRAFEIGWEGLFPKPLKYNETASGY